ncbi:MAG: trypsin-like peptidase domain-containing protein [Saprospiraceae bacterium]|nr:trypsin-like peptidase domain-containing protein [Saprospiraceae bacterium]
MELTIKQRIALRNELMKLYPSIPESQLVLGDAGISTDNIAFNPSRKLNWNTIINETLKHEMILELIEVVLSEYPKNEVLIQLKKELSIDKSDNMDQKDSEKVMDAQISLLKSFVSTGKIKVVIDKLLIISKSVSKDYENSVILISAQYNGLEKDIINGIVNSQNKLVRENRLRLALLATINNLKSEVQLYRKLEEFNLNVDKEISNEIIHDSFKRSHVRIEQSESELQKVIGDRPNYVKKSWFLKGLEASKAVGRIYVKLTSKFSGTGFLLKGGYLLTNAHVLASEAFLEGSFIELSLPDDSNADERVYRYNFDPSFFYVRPLAINKEGAPEEFKYDYALVKLLENGKVPIEEFGYLTFEEDIEPKKNDPVNIIQHPGGEIQLFSVTANEVIGNWDHYLYYKADTDKGASGSPVLNQNWKVVALHHAGKNEESKDGGLRIDEEGTVVPANRGILIKYILKDLKTRGFTF